MSDGRVSLSSVRDQSKSASELLASRQQLVQRWFSPVDREDHQQQSPVESHLLELFQTPFPVETVSTRNCENLIGSVALPVGVAGPVRVSAEQVSAPEWLQPFPRLAKSPSVSKTSEEESERSSWNSELMIPLATTEGALVASINRGCKALNQCVEGVLVQVERRGMTRSPVFVCPNGKAAHVFRQWFEEHLDRIRQIAEQTSSHLSLLSYQSWVRGRHVYVRFAFDTDEAMGMNMVTIALQAALQEALERHPEIRLVSLSSNVCTDKKDSIINTLFGKGYNVQAEAFVSAETLATVLKTTPQAVLEVHTQKNLIGSSVAGSHSQNAHVANVLAAFYLATGQDPAHAVDGSQAFLSVELDTDGEGQTRGLYLALNLPSVAVGVVGGGTGLPAQSQARTLIAPGQELTAWQLAAAAGAAALAGELSLLSALASNQLACAHQKLGRGSCGTA